MNERLGLQYNGPSNDIEDNGIPSEVMPDYLGRFSPKGNFEGYLSSRKESAIQLPDEQQELIRDQLAEQGLGEVVALEALPMFFAKYIGEMTPQDWECAKFSANPTLTLCSITNFYRLEHIWSIERDIERPYGHNDNLRYLADTVNLSEPDPEEMAEFGKLPFVHAATLDSLFSIIETGTILSDRENHALQRERNTGADYQYVSNTHREDREAGLDRYVFCNFGKPGVAGEYGDVELLIRPDAFLGSSEAFATENDFLDINIQLDEKKGNDRYLEQVLQGEYFYRAAACRLKHELVYRRGRDAQLSAHAFLAGETGTKDQYGGTTFSTWEVKMPPLSMGDIRAVVFRSPEKLTEFLERYPEPSFSVAFVPTPRDVREALRDIYGTTLDFIERGEAAHATLPELIKAISELYPDIYDKLKDHYGMQPILDPTEAYLAGDDGGTALRLQENELNRGGVERVRKFKESQDEKLQIYVQIGDTYEGINETTNIYKLAPGLVFLSEEEALAYLKEESRSKNYYAARSPFRDPGEQPSYEHSSMRLARITVLKGELERCLYPDKGKGEERKKLDTYLVEGTYVLYESGERMRDSGRQ